LVCSLTIFCKHPGQKSGCGLGGLGEKICFPPRGDRETNVQWTFGERQRGETFMEVFPKGISSSSIAKNLRPRRGDLYGRPQDERIVFGVARLDVIARRSRGNLKNKSTRLLQDFVLRNDTPCQIAELVLSVSEGSLLLLAMTLRVRLLR